MAFDFVNLKTFEQTISKIKEVLTRHKNKLDELERRIELLENDPFKMPFDR